MDADLDLLLIAVHCTADDLLPKRPENAKRILTDAEVVTLSVAQHLLRISSDEQFWAMAPRRLGHLFPRLPQRPGFVKRRQRLADTIEALIAEFARHSPGSEDDLLIVDSTPIECGRSIETMRRSALADAADYDYRASHSRLFWGFRLHGLFAIDGTPRALALTSPKTGERDVSRLVDSKRWSPRCAERESQGTTRSDSTIRAGARSSAIDCNWPAFRRRRTGR